jgi:hypothetical protein
MATRTIAVATLTALLIIAAAAPSSVAWTAAGRWICTATLDQSDPMMVSDGAGGAIVVWEDYRSTDWDIYAQRIDGAGAPLWTADGIVVTSVAGTEDLLQVVPGWSGEAIILWKRSSYIYVQKIDATCAKLWGSTGVRINMGSVPSVAVMTADGAGGAIVAWIESRSGTANVYAQRIASDGTTMWADPGVTISAAAGNEADPRIVSDGMGGALVAFVNNATATPNIYVQRVRASGVTWGGNGVAVGTGTYPASNPAIASDGADGAIVTWEYGTSNRDVAVQRVTATGAVSWTAGGILLTPSGSDQYNPEIVEDGLGGAVVVWQDMRTLEVELYAQRIDTFGEALWTADGVLVRPRPADPTYHRLIASSQGRVIVVSADAGNVLRARVLDAAGGVAWDSHGVYVLGGTVSLGQYGAISDGAGGLLAAVSKDGPSASIDIRAQGINRFGRISVPEPKILDVTDVPGDQGGKVRISVAASDRDSIGLFDAAIASYGVWQRMGAAALRAELDGAPGGVTASSLGPGVRLIEHQGRRFIQAAPAGIFPTGSWEYVGGFDATQSQEYIYRATTVADSSGSGVPYQVYVVTAHAADPAMWFASAPDSGYSVDNLPPGVPEDLAGEQEYSPAGLSLTWTLGAENDLSHYAVYRGTSEGFVPGAGNRIATPADPEWFDGSWGWDSGYYYKVAAVDVHGNESGYALLRPDDVTGSDKPKTPKASYLSQNYPNPFNPTTRIEFGLNAPATVSLRIYDAAGRLVRSLVEGARLAGNYREVWDGKDAGGASVSSGVYFYRLDAGAFSKTNKMIVLR